MPLRAKSPVKTSLRLKAYIYGLAGVGKTLAALQFSNAYIIDTAKETTRYAKLINDKKSEVFECSNPFEVLKELQYLSEQKHRFRTVIIDEITTLYQNLQTIWTDRFIEAAEKDNSKNSKTVLLQDFGFRYWDKVKRDWRRIIDALRNLDMNVIVNAHQKDKYGPNQSIIGIASDSEKNDEYVFDFVFRLITRGKEFKAITEKQRVLPVELDPESKQFPKEFFWNYNNLLNFYNQEYLECESLTLKTGKVTDNFNELKEKSDKIQQHRKVEQETKENIKQNNNNNNNLSNLDKIKLLLKENKISVKSFKIFLREICKWTYIKKLDTIKESDQAIILNRWETVKTEYKKYISNNTKNNESSEQKQINKSVTNYEPNKPIRDDQRETLIKKLEESNISIKRFFSEFSIKRWEDIQQEGANNMIKNFEVILGALL